SRVFKAPAKEALYTGVATTRPSAWATSALKCRTCGLSKRACSRSSAANSRTWKVTTSTPRSCSHWRERSRSTPERERVLGLPPRETTSMEDASLNSVTWPRGLWAPLDEVTLTARHIYLEIIFFHLFIPFFVLPFGAAERPLSRITVPGSSRSPCHRSTPWPWR